MRKATLLISSVLAMMAMNGRAQHLKDGYITWGYSSEKFGQELTKWTPGSQISEDDNFFISRVKPRKHFRNNATQVRLGIDPTIDKRLVAWVPVNDPQTNALPNGIFDSEVFSMWNYVDHWGNWSAPLGRVPAAFLDAAHKNGVAVTSVAGIPYGSLAYSWKECLEKMSKAGADKAAQFLNYYGVDGFGYNSEYGGGYAPTKAIREFHVALNEKMKDKNPIFENMWYDGTNDQGSIMFDNGLGTHNDDNFGKDGKPAASLFFNYNWSAAYLLDNSVKYAKSINRDPLYLYAGVNMQGGEPKNGINWTLLKDYPISIGLWGAHTQNMFWESRGEKGSTPDIKQRTYMLRTERWFTGGTRNPANNPAMKNSLQYNADNFDFPGMSSMMSARSTLSWDLAEEPFITYFNLGNGKYFNWMGKQQNNREWYNIGVQDYLPTWRWWFANKVLGRESSDVVANGLNAEFSWDEAYMGGSSLRINGTSANEYLHLFKTQYALATGDVITLRYKVKSGKADVRLALTAEGAEGTVINESDFNVLTTTHEADEDVWVEKKFTLTDAFNGKKLALVALHLENADNLDFYLGEFSLLRPSAAVAAPAAPQITSTKLLSFSRSGVDAKLIFNMQNSKAAGEPVYNSDVNTSMFKLYAQQEGKEPVLMGVTTSWAAMFYNIPLQLTETKAKVKLGVSALSIDHKTESAITWSEYLEASDYAYSDDIQINKKTIKPNEAFEMSYVDPLHEDGTWKLLDANGAVVFTGTGNKVQVPGLANVGSYTLQLVGNEETSTGRKETTREFASFVQISGKEVGALPEIKTLTANGETSNIEIKVNEAAQFAYTGREADGSGSQGVELKEERFGVPAADIKVVGNKSFGVAYWLKINKLSAGSTQLLSVASKKDGWPKTDWGWIWTSLNQDGTIGSYTFRGTDATNNKELQYTFGNTKLPVGNWVHLAYNFEYDASGAFRSDFYVNGIKQEVTKWKHGGAEKTTPVGFESDVYAITNGMVLAAGGTAHGRAGIDGVIDNFQVWNRAITNADVQTSMKTLKKEALPEGLAALWTFEDKAADKKFKSVGTLTVDAGLHNYVASGGEGQGNINWVEPTYTSGCPFIAGTAFPVTTTASWTAKKATITDATGNDQAGSAKIAFAKDGTYDVTLTLSNALGSDSKTFSVVKVGTGISGIETAQMGDFKAVTVGENVLVEFEQAGRYNISLYNVAGQMVAQKAANIAQGNNVSLRLGTPGTYLLRVERDGKLVRTVKLIKH